MPGWTIEDDILATEDGEWTKTQDFDPQAEDRGWKSSPLTISPLANTSGKTYLGFGGFAVEELDMFPEEMTLEPESLQADHHEWTILTDITDETE